MQFKILLSVGFALSCGVAAHAQDRIYTNKGTIYEAKVKEIGIRNIIYKKWNNQDGPDYVIAKSEVARIKYQNGDEERFGDDNNKMTSKSGRRSTSLYGRNIIGVSPVHMTNVSAVGFGLSYERMLDRENIVSLYLPAVFSFKRSTDEYYFGQNQPFQDRRSMLWFYPGVKIYPTGSDGVVRYSVGPSMAVGTGNRQYTRQIYDPNTGNSSYLDVSKDIFVMGVMVNNTLNVQPSPKVRIGLELGLGIPYYTNEDRDAGYYNLISEEPLVQFNFTVGYRF